MREIAEDHDWDDSNDAGDSDDSRPAEARVSPAGELPVVIWASPLHSCEFLSPCLSFSLPVTIILGSRVAAGENWRQEKCFSCSNDNSKNCLRGYFGLSPGGRGERSDCDWIWIFDLSPVLGVLPVNFNAPVIQFLSLPTSLEGSRSNEIGAGIEGGEGGGGHCQWCQSLHDLDTPNWGLTGLSLIVWTNFAWLWVFMTTERWISISDELERVTNRIIFKN